MLIKRIDTFKNFLNSIILIEDIKNDNVIFAFLTYDNVQFSKFLNQNSIPNSFNTLQLNKTIEKEQDYLNKFLLQFNNVKSKVEYNYSKEIDSYYSQLNNFLQNKLYLERQSQKLIKQAMNSLFELSNTMDSISKCHKLIIEQINQLNKKNNFDLSFDLTNNYCMQNTFEEFSNFFNQFILQINQNVLKGIRNMKIFDQQIMEKISDRTEINK